MPKIYYYFKQVNWLKLHLRTELRLILFNLLMLLNNIIRWFPLLKKNKIFDKKRENHKTGLDHG